MRVCVYGAGAIGGYLAGKLAAAGVEVAVVARGAHLAAIAAQGLRVLEEEQEFRVWLEASDDPLRLRRININERGTTSPAGLLSRLLGVM